LIDRTIIFLILSAQFPVSVSALAQDAPLKFMGRQVIVDATSR
jgi:hypothetical protein